MSLPGPLNRPRIRLASRVFNRLLGHLVVDPLALHYAIRIFVGTAFLWLLLQRMGDNHAIWAIITLVFVTEPKLKDALENFRHRIYNTAVGCGIAIVALLAAGPRHWVLPAAMTVAVLLSTRTPEAPASWRTTPIATGIVLSAGLSAQSWAVGLQTALIRAGEVFLGGVTALVIAWLMAMIWMPEDEKKKDTPDGTPV